MCSLAGATPTFWPAKTVQIHFLLFIADTTAGA